MNAPKPRPSKPLTYTPPKFEKTTVENDVLDSVMAGSDIQSALKTKWAKETPVENVRVSEGPVANFNIFDHIMNNDPEFMNDLRELGRAIHGETLGENIKREKPEEKKPRDMESPMTHRPFQQSEALRELQRELNRGTKR